jgi:rhamnose utilization protein RhaD (predicted bifunctional aldolase and dehydrogenase)/NAD(P)-dependent dehydrogenase (short-subunit alcohol dehydrogenase family)
MQSLWDQHEASQYPGELGQRVYSSRLLGRDPTLVMHGGGNTSVKLRQQNIFGEEEELLYVKGSGWNLETIQEAGFAPVRMAHLLRLATLPALSDAEMAKELKVGMTNPAAPAPSVEAILHAVLPYKYVDHTHADAFIAVSNTPHGPERVRDIYGDTVVVIPYVMPGFALAKLCAERFPAEANDQTIGMVLLNHGVFSFGETAELAYTRMIDLVSRAEAYLADYKAWHISVPAQASTPPATDEALRHDLAALRHDISAVAGFPVVMATHRDDLCLHFARRPDVGDISQQGPATPDHVIRTKRMPLVGRDVQAFRAAYEHYFATHAPQAAQPLTMLDPAPRVVLDPQFGLCTIGRTAKDAAVVEDIYRHTMQIILRATALEQYQALPAGDLFDVEYWELEQAKLRRQGSPPAFAGEVALVTGAAAGIGKACVESLLARGAAVVGLDIDPQIEHLFNRKDFCGITCDITQEAALLDALEQAVRAFGGLDMLVLNAGIFQSSRRIEQMQLDDWRTVTAVNLDANVVLMREAYPLLKLAPRGGRVVVIGTKNVPAPGPGVSAYSASKAALNQLARVAALEWGSDGIRVNTIHPNAVFDTNLWTDEILQTRAKHYDISVEEYKRNNVLGVEVTSSDVGELAAEMCGALFARTTGAQVPVDGGNERVI